MGDFENLAAKLFRTGLQSRLDVRSDVPREENPKAREVDAQHEGCIVARPARPERER